MAKLMWIFGILLIAAGLALGIVLLVSAARPAGIDIQTAAILLVGGILALGFGSVIDGQAAALEKHPIRSLLPEPIIPAGAAIPEFDPRSAKTAASDVAAEAPRAIEDKSPVRPVTPSRRSSRPARRSSSLRRAQHAARRGRGSRQRGTGRSRKRRRRRRGRGRRGRGRRGRGRSRHRGRGGGRWPALCRRGAGDPPPPGASCPTARWKPRRRKAGCASRPCEHLDEYLDAMEPPRG